MPRDILPDITKTVFVGGIEVVLSRLTSGINSRTEAEKLARLYLDGGEWELAEVVWSSNDNKPCASEHRSYVAYQNKFYGKDKPRPRRGGLPKGCLSLAAWVDQERQRTGRGRWMFRFTFQKS